MAKHTTWPEKKLFRFSEGTTDRIRAVAYEDEDQSQFARVAVDNEIERRVVDKGVPVVAPVEGGRDADLYDWLADRWLDGRKTEPSPKADPRRRTILPMTDFPRDREILIVTALGTETMFVSATYAGELSPGSGRPKLVVFATRTGQMHEATGWIDVDLPDRT